MLIATSTSLTVTKISTTSYLMQCSSPRLSYLYVFPYIQHKTSSMKHSQRENGRLLGHVDDVDMIIEELKKTKLQSPVRYSPSYRVRRVFIVGSHWIIPWGSLSNLISNICSIFSFIASTLTQSFQISTSFFMKTELMRQI